MYYFYFVSSNKNQETFMKKILLLFSFLSSIISFAQDECASAIVLTPSTVCQSTSGTLLNATTSTTTTGCGGYFDVFYKFVATSAAVDITATPASGSTLDLRISAFSTCGATFIDCQDRTGSGSSEYLNLSALTIGNTYYIKLAHYYSTAVPNQNFTICAVNVTRPVNDECAGALTLTSSSTCTPTSGTFLNATASNVSSGCYGNFDVFYKFVATSASTLITATPASGTNITLALYTGCGSNASACNDFAATSVAETMTLDNLLVGTTYYVKVSTTNSSAPTNPAFTICAQSQTPPAAVVNDECGNATLLTQSGTCNLTSGTLLGATKSTTPSSCAANKDAFYKFVATATSADIKVASSNGLNTTVSVFSSCGATAALACVNNVGAGSTELIRIGDLLVGSTYYIKVASSDYAPVTNDFTICVQSVTRPVNDDCSGAISLTPSNGCVATSGTLLNASASSINQVSCVSSTNSDVFYKFVAASTATSVTITPSSGVDPVFSVRTACGGTSLACVDASGSGGIETTTLNNLVIGSTYYIKVENYGGIIPTSPTFDICVQNQVSTTPANDECTGAILLNTSSTCSPVSGTLANATTSAITTSCSANKDVFYKFVAVAPTATVTATSTTGMDLVIATYSACGGTALACKDDGIEGGTETINMTGLTVGNTYYIKVQSYYSSATNYTFTICVTSAPVVVTNDECAGAIALTTATTCTTVSGSLLNATTSTVTSSCSGYNDVFYKFVANATTATVTATSGTGLDLVLATYAGCGTTALACRDALGGGGTESISMTGLTIGNTYYIKVQGFAPTTTNNAFTLCVASTPTVTLPANDECSGAITLTAAATCTPVSGTLLNATTSTITTASCATSNSDVFYKFVANASTAIITATAGSGIDLVLSTHGTCGGASLACIDNNADAGSEVLNLSGLTIGSTYYIRVADYGTSIHTSNAFTICVASTPAVVPANDECAGAIAITPTTSCTTPYAGTLANATTSTVTASCQGNYDVFYKFTAASTSTTVTVQPSTGLDAVLGVFTACGGTYIDCNEESVVGGGTEFAVLNSLTIGNTYYIKVSSWSSAPTTSTFTVCVQNGTSTATASSTALSSIQLYPNPTQNVLYVSNITTGTKVELIDLAGKTLMNETISDDAKLDLANYSAGVYILKLTIDGVTENRRVVLSK